MLGSMSGEGKLSQGNMRDNNIAPDTYTHLIFSFINKF